MSTVLVTGGSGFVGTHCLLRLINEGHTVRTTVRDLKREADVRAYLKTGGADPKDRITFFAADLEKDDGWAKAVEGCDYVMHVASPFPVGIPKDENELIRPARDGALRVLRASRDAGVKRVVLTSSFAAVGYGHPEQEAPFDEKTWTNLDGPGVAPYIKSKTIAERAAWDFIMKEGKGLELTSVNPVGIFGPALGKDLSTSIEIVRQMLEGKFPAFPKIYFGAVDVRDVADLHLSAMTHPKANGERFLAISGNALPLIEFAKILKEGMGPIAKKVSLRSAPSWLVRVLGLFDPMTRQAVPELDKIKGATSEKAQRLLGWKPKSVQESVIASAESLVRLGIIPKD